MSGGRYHRRVALRKITWHRRAFTARIRPAAGIRHGDAVPVQRWKMGLVPVEMILFDNVLGVMWGLSHAVYSRNPEDIIMAEPLRRLFAVDNKHVIYHTCPCI